MTTTGVVRSHDDGPRVVDVRRVGGEVVVTFDRVVADYRHPVPARYVHTGGATRVKIQNPPARTVVTHNQQVLFDGFV